MIFKDETNEIVACAIKIHKKFGPGLLESAYRECLYYELKRKFDLVEKEKGLPLIYEEVKLEYGYRMDIVVNNTIVIELKAVERLRDIHLAQVLTYLKVGDFPLGLLINFNEKLLYQGIKRVINT